MLAAFGRAEDAAAPAERADGQPEHKYTVPATFTTVKSSGTVVNNTARLTLVISR